ncbi:ABC transporter ATP-binding protein [Patulibacter brassicae]|uniref:ABC transporter ATP-binding protein n=1 Tax=Patulibacter brassicae TaxID=1705717 RepID=A0ABU4VLJ3_9ACTN|nr:ABC transporter ATP-binding protein [Patulibacter brassicae]MDX8152698.1 ABC transporter ATP-binding protein [Patulibacter brassicae]
MSLQVQGLRAGYGRATILEDVSVEVAPGEVAAVIGSNGAGKTTLVKTIAGSLAARGGRILQDGDAIGGLPPEKRARRGVVMVPEGRRLFGNLTVEENIRLGRQAARGRDEGDDPVEPLLEAFPIVRERWTQRAGLLSGGEQQMVALTRAVAGRPRYLLLDEPSLGLSPRLTQEVFRLVRLVVETTNAGVILVEQMADQALKLATNAYVLDQGRVSASGPAEEIRRSDAVRKAYLGG